MNAMTEDELKALILNTLQEIAPDVDISTVEGGIAFYDQFDFDSMDYLNFSIALHQKLQVDIPETDYPRLGTINGCIEYLKDRVGT